MPVADPAGIEPTTPGLKSVQPFDKTKIVKTCLRSGANREIAEETAEKIEAKEYNGIETEKILEMIFRYLRKHRLRVYI